MEFRFRSERIEDRAEQIVVRLEGDRFTYRENTREIIGERSRKKYSLGERVKVILDRIDHVQRKLQFALVEEEKVKPQRTQRGRK